MHEASKPKEEAQREMPLPSSQVPIAKSASLRHSRCGRDSPLHYAKNVMATALCYKGAVTTATGTSQTLCNAAHSKPKAVEAQAAHVSYSVN